MSNILSISTEDDPHIEMVQAHLDNPIWIFDASKFPFETNITYSFNDGKLIVTSDGRDLTSVNSIWFRKPVYLAANQFPVEEEYQQFTLDAYLSAVKAIYDLMGDKFWMSDFRRIIKANNKVYQLGLAHSVGFLVPNTIVTSRPEDAVDFRKKEKHIITKSLSFAPIEVDGETLAFYAVRIDPDDEIDFSGLPLAPAIFQREVQDKVDIRITIVGDKLFPCRIVPRKGLIEELDWRQGILTEDIEYEPCIVPDEIAEKCLAFLKLLGLTFGVIEFAIDKNGDYWFLEINPNGQWAFIEMETGLEISKEIAKVLERSSI